MRAVIREEDRNSGRRGMRRMQVGPSTPVPCVGGSGEKQQRTRRYVVGHQARRARRRLRMQLTPASTGPAPGVEPVRVGVGGSTTEEQSRPTRRVIGQCAKASSRRKAGGQQSRPGRPVPGPAVLLDPRAGRLTRTVSAYSTEEQQLSQGRVVGHGRANSWGRGG